MIGNMIKKPISLLGAGGMAREFVSWITQSNYEIEYLYDSNQHIDVLRKIGECRYPVSRKFRKESLYIMAVGYPNTKEKIINSIKEKINWADAIVHPSVIIGNNIILSKGSVVCPLSVLTADIIIKKLATINTLVTIGHNCRIGEMFHASPGSTVSGNVSIGDRVFLGTNACIKEKITVCNDVIIGAGTVVIKDITESGIYAGNPAIQIGCNK
jgi:sugar O-acyltransferase (sialic acid O-acetyltransferase NeuD family)